MSLQLEREVVVEAVALAVERVLAGAGAARLVDQVAEAICARFELLTPAEAAAMLNVSTRRLQSEAGRWGLDKSVALGVTNPRYFLSQVLARLREKTVRGARPKSEPVLLPQSRAA